MDKVHHVLGISGGKDSAALAIYMSNEFPNLDVSYFFTDTGKELPEVYSFLEKMNARLNKEIEKLESNFDFDYWLKRHKNFLPSATARWCTVNLKLKPFEKWVQPWLEAGDRVVNYVAIRADENRKGYVPTNPAIETKFPLSEAGIDRQGVEKLLDDAGIGLPKYYKWRSRSGCFFCFYQQKIEWIRLKERHPDKFEEAKAYEKIVGNGHSQFTWCEGESLSELEKPKRVKEITEEFEKRKNKLLSRRKKRSLQNPLLEGIENNDNISVDDIMGINPNKAICVTCHK
tara:strand:- start:2238 stop:3098 length:861 start_codon:yes stop_codon:yes gene_type:complete